MQTTGKEISLYFHIPFCKKKCPYCHFYSIYHKEDLEKLYLKAVKNHFEKYKHLIKKNNVISVYFGGGTPSLLNINTIKEILDFIEIPKKSEITLEVNPEDICYENIKSYKSLNINRVSLGVQSFDDGLLKILQRRHTAKKSKEIINAFYDSQIENISIDLMYDVMTQKMSSWEKTIKEASKLPITHISLYNLTFEEHTAFYKNKDALLKLLPKENESLDLLNYAVAEFEKLNFKRYEISAFSKDGYNSIHNTGYWTGREFLGFGPSAFSYFEKKRFRNICNLKNYAKAFEADISPIEFEEELKYPDDINELLAINLRLIEGVNIKGFENRFGLIPPKTMQTLKDSKFVTFDNDNIKLNEKGLLFYDTLASEII